MTRKILGSAKNIRGTNAKSFINFFHSLFNDVSNLFKFPCPKLILVRLFKGSLLTPQKAWANTKLYGGYNG